VFTVSGWIANQSLDFYATHTERFSALIAIVLTTFSVVFPIGMVILLQVYMNPFFARNHVETDNLIEARTKKYDKIIKSKLSFVSQTSIELMPKPNFQQAMVGRFDTLIEPIN
jgi:hypothetical protein